MLGIPDQDWAAFKVLRKRLGLWSALALAWRAERRTKAGHPFENLPTSDDPKEIASREQIGPALVIYQELTKRMDEEAAYAIVAELVEAAAHVFLRDTIGPLNRRDLVVLAPDEKVTFLEERLDRFPNTTTRVDSVGDTEVNFTVTRCSFVRLCREVGLPGLAPMFCAVDASYFGNVEPGLELVRPTTIASGGDSCPFSLRFTDSEPPT